MSELLSDPRIKQLSDHKIAEWRRWFDSRLDDAIEAAATTQHPEIERECFHQLSRVIGASLSRKNDYRG